jgi:hypothetical protein
LIPWNWLDGKLGNENPSSVNSNGDFTSAATILEEPEGSPEQPASIARSPAVINKTRPVRFPDLLFDVNVI